jgi:hypothetical protein
MVDLIGEILKRIKNAEHNTKEAMASGVNVHNFDDYQRLLGNREGLTQALGIVEDLLSEDDDENL